MFCSGSHFNKNHSITIWIWWKFHLISHSNIHCIVIHKKMLQSGDQEINYSKWNFKKNCEWKIVLWNGCQATLSYRANDVFYHFSPSISQFILQWQYITACSPNLYNIIFLVSMGFYLLWTTVGGRQFHLHSHQVPQDLSVKFKLCTMWCSKTSLKHSLMMALNFSGLKFEPKL